METIKFYPIDVKQQQDQSIVIHAGDVAGATPYHHCISAGHSLKMGGSGDAYHILTQIAGSARYLSGGHSDSIDERATYIPAPDQDLVIEALTDTQILEIRWETREGDEAELELYKTSFPVIQLYRDAIQYRDRNKSEKTISRAIIEQRTIPRFALGSVETFGPDWIKAHDHPMLDQYFYSFPENDAFITIGGEPYRMRGNELLYIPLGAVHGVDVVQGKHCHYMWIDFMVDDTAMHRLDTSHIATGTKRSFDL